MGKVNTLEVVDLEEPYAPGRIYPQAKEETVTLFREIFLHQILEQLKFILTDLCIIIKLLFYYKDNAADLEINNKLCVVGAKVKGFLDEELNLLLFWII